jgi:hypothetical protein
MGFDRGNGSVYFEGKGETSPEFARSIRRLFPSHGCARADVCEDYRGPGVFEQLLDVVRLAKGPRVDGGYVRLPDDECKGRTWGAGARGGVGYVRVYEAGKMAGREHLGLDAVRLEGEFRPHYAAQKKAAASMEPHQFWGMSAWTHRVGEAISQVELPRFENAAREYTRHKTTEYLARTYRRHWEYLLEVTGGDQAAVMQIMAEVWREDDEVAEALRAAAAARH